MTVGVQMLPKLLRSPSDDTQGQPRNIDMDMAHDAAYIKPIHRAATAWSGAATGFRVIAAARSTALTTVREEQSIVYCQ